MSKLKEMLAVIDDQRKGERAFGTYMLESLSDQQLDKVEDFLRSFYSDPVTGKVPEATGRAARKERLGALEFEQQRNEERIADLKALVGKLTTSVEFLSNRLSGTHTLLTMEGWINAQTSRHDQAMEIVGARIGEIVERLDKLEHRLSGPFWQDESPELTPERADLVRSYAVPFPTGAATTVDDALAAVPPVDDSPPRRGDRVRLEGAFSTTGRPLPNGWHTVTGADDKAFQIEAPSDVRFAAWLAWVSNNDPGLKEIRRAPTPRSPIEPENGLDV